MISSLVSIAQIPANDNCSGAQNLGTLPTPAACPSGIGTAVNAAGTNINATYPVIYTTLLGCQTGGNQPGPAYDVWYSFVASGNIATINITPGTAPTLASPAITLWRGNCAGLIGVGCDNNGTAGGNNSAVFQPLTPGQTYYIQVSGMNNIAQGNFNISVAASNDCNNCLQIGNLTVSPAPVNGTYAPNTAVTFCYNISSYTQVSSNWLHGLTYTFGCGWNPASIVATPPASCSGSGTWSWYNTWTSSANASVWGPGFAFNYNTPVDANPGNNFGDNCATPNWNFCMTITTDAVCVPGCTSLNMSINTTGDGESGSWGSVACTGDPNVQFSGVLSCCTTTASRTNPTCFNGSNGTATATPNGSAPFTYSWNSTPVQTTQVATGLPAGTYTCTVTDNNGCISTAVVTLTNPTPLTVSTTTINATCSLLNGSATANAVGGTGPYTYSWNTTPVQTTQTASGIGAGTYTVTVTSVGPCTSTATATVSSTGSITATATSTNVSCFGGTNGTASVTPLGGGPYTYTWNTTPVQNTQTATNLPAGSYTVTVSSSGCTTTASVIITQPTLLTVATTQTNTTCGLANGSATATPSGGTGPYTYLWSNGQTTQTVTNLLSGPYTVTVTSVGGCTVTSNILILNTGAPSVTIPTQTNVSCFGGINGVATSSITGGVSPFTYSWNTIPVQTTPSATNLPAGNYTVTITGANGCTATAAVVITQPTQLNASITTANVLCFGNSTGSATATPSGGTSPYTYLWSNTQTTPITNSLLIGTYNCTVTDANGCNIIVSANITQPTQLTLATTSSINPLCNGSTNGSITVAAAGGVGPNYLYSINAGPNQLTPTFTNLTAGNYSILVTDQNGCTATVTVTLTQPTTLTLNANIGNVNCFNACNGTLLANPTGGTLPYSYLYSNGSTSNPVSGLCAGTYSVLVTDLHGCQVSMTGLTISQPNLLIVNPSALPTSICIGQTSSLNSNPAGGTLPYTYSWSSGATTQNTSVSPVTTTNYIINISDANGCTATNNITVNVNPPLSGSASSTPSVICAGQSSTITSSATGGDGTPYLFTWAPGGTGQTLNVNPNITTAYTVTISDGCSPNVTYTTTVTVNQLPVVTYSTSNLTGCEPLTVTYTNTTPLSGSCIWTIDGVPTNNCTVTQTFPTQGTYPAILTVTGSNGCISSSGTINAQVNPVPIASFSTSPSIVNILNPTIDFNNLSSIGSYQWSFGDGNNSTYTYPSHTYGDTGSFNIQLIVTTQFGCADTTYGTIFIYDIFSVYVPNSFTPNADGRNDSWFPVITGADFYEFWIFDRWGEQIYYSTVSGTPWDGSYKEVKVKDDVYVWKLNIKEKNSAKRHNLVGHVTVIK